MAIADHHRTGQARRPPVYPRHADDVYDVLSYLAAGMTVDEILDDFPYLAREDIQACLAFAAEREGRMLVAVE
jgi:hypothetical protein